MTDAEQAVWRRLRGKRPEGYRFRKQVPLGPYIVDFACMDPKLVVELGGGQHTVSAARDAIRTRRLEAHGFRVLRFWNNQVAANMEAVLDAIVNTLRELDDGV